MQEELIRGRRRNGIIVGKSEVIICESGLILGTFAYINFDKMNNKIHNLSDFIFDLQGQGKMYFTIDMVRAQFSWKEEIIKKYLHRFSKKNAILSIRQGFYLIIPPEYSHSGILPPEMFIHELMSYLKQNYYVALLTAAMYHGASHQKPQEFFVVIEGKSLRRVEKNGVRINFITKKNLNLAGINQIKTSTGYMNISNPEMTFLDLLTYENRIGGINRAIEIMMEINETLSIARFKKVLENVQITVLQRAAYILENLLERKNFADYIFIKLNPKKIYRTGLSSRVKNIGNCTNRWKVVENIILEIESGNKYP